MYVASIEMKESLFAVFAGHGNLLAWFSPA
jgi:hypothetical protein